MSVYVLLPLFARVYLVKASSTLCCDKNDNINAPKSCQVWYKLALVPECCKQLSALLMCAHHKWVSSVSVTNNAGRCVIPAISECQPIKIIQNSWIWILFTDWLARLTVDGLVARCGETLSPVHCIVHSSTVLIMRWSNSWGMWGRILIGCRRGCRNLHSMVMSLWRALFGVNMHQVVLLGSAS